MSIINSFQRLAAVLPFALVMAGSLAAQGDESHTRASTIMVFDVSNSMWGQIDGVSKIEIAREVIGELVQDWDAGTDLGLVAYGHRRTGDCSDIQEVIPVGPVDPSSFSATVNRLVPRGRTPLTDAVRQAANLLNYRDVPSTVILVSDGIESCNADPCALARDLEKGGIDFTAHVIGFDVAAIEDQGQLSCLADETGGQYLTADNADELGAALREVAAPPPPMLRLEAVSEAGGQPIPDPSIRWTLVALDAEDTLLDGAVETRPSLVAEAGKYFARAELGDRVGSVEFEYAGDEDALYQVVLAVPVMLDAPETVETAAEFGVIWSGPNAAGDFIALATPGSDAMKFQAYVRTSGGSPATFTAPIAPGDFLLRYVSATAGEVLAERPIAVLGAFAEIKAPPVVVAGSTFKVSWNAPGAQNDFVAIVPQGAADGEGGNYAYTRHGNPSVVRAQDKPGAYELRYVSGQSRSVLARLPITVIPPEVALEAVPTAVEGAQIAVTWDGPDNKNDSIVIVPAGSEEAARGNFAYTRHGNPADVRAPDDAGAYELRYVSGQDRQTLAALPIAIVPADASLEASPSATSGSDVLVTWAGPDNKNDSVIVVPAGAPMDARGNLAYTRHGNPAKLRMPEDEGLYELRYVTGQERKVLATLPIAVKGAEVTLEASPAASAGAGIPVNWIGPDNKNDFIEIVPAGSAEKERGTFAYTRHGNPADVRAPDEAGQYELRYRSGQDRRILAIVPITITDVSAELETTPAANAGAEVQVMWSGPDSKNDYIVVVPSGSADDTRGNFAYTRHGNPAKVRLPDDAGSYEFRYVTGQSRRVLASIPIEALPTSASLDAVPVAPAGQTIEVTWTGPDNKNDHVAIAIADSPDKEKVGQAYTRHGNPAKIKLPAEPGNYELRYVTGQDRHVLERLPITVN